MDKYIFCKKYHLTEKQFKGEEWIFNSLTIDEEELPKGFNPKIDGDFKLSNLKVIPSWFNPVVRYDLRLPSVISFDHLFDPVVGRSIFLVSLTEIPFGWKPTVSYELYLGSITTLPEWFEPVAWEVYFNDREEHTEKFRPENDFYSWRNGKYIKVDGFLTEVVRHEDNVFHVKEFGEDQLFYLVTDGNGVYDYGATISEAKAYLNKKIEGNTINGIIDKLSELNSLAENIGALKQHIGDTVMESSQLAEYELKREQLLQDLKAALLSSGKKTA